MSQTTEPHQHDEPNQHETDGADAAVVVQPVSDLFGLTGQVAVVTGASSGLGARFARVLHEAGATVVLAARREDRLAALSDELERSIVVRCDVGLAEDRTRLIDVTLEEAGGLDVLVNNAGIGTPMRAEDEPLEHFEKVVEVNLTALFDLSRLAARHMLVAEGGGSIVNVASILGLVASSPIHQASYAASKGGVVNLTRELAVQWARRGVRVNALAPGWFPSEMTTTMFTDEASGAYLRRNTPIGRGGIEGELDGALLFLASAASSYVTGHVLTVDGGWVAR